MYAKDAGREQENQRDSTSWSGRASRKCGTSLSRAAHCCPALTSDFLSCSRTVAERSTRSI